MFVKDRKIVMMMRRKNKIKFKDFEKNFQL
jgi:hypothetical protein